MRAFDSQDCQDSFCILKTGTSQAFPDVLRGVEFFGEAHGPSKTKPVER